MFSRKILSNINNNLKVITCKTKNSSSTMKEYQQRIFSGIQPTGSVHLGNYVGAIQQWIKLQNTEPHMSIAIVDLHSMTLPHDPKVLSKNILEMTAILIACGIDVNKVVLFQQSTVPQHTELFWYLGCISTMARLKHLPQFKEKSASLKDIPLGLYLYPVLQAADILSHKATHIPVGEDQLQHLQLAQELVKMFNSRYGNTFPVPHALITDTPKIRSLRNPAKKMSKSDPDLKSCIFLTDSSEEIFKKLKKAVTDFTPKITYDPENRVGITNLLNIHSSVTGKSVNTICEEVKDMNTVEYKSTLAEVLESHIAPIREKYNELLLDTDYLLQILETGKEKASAIAEDTLKEVRYKLGLQSTLENKEKVKMHYR